MAANPSLPWPFRCLPDLSLHQVGAFPMLTPDCNRTYSHETIALHLHDYAGDIRLGKNRYSLRPGDITIAPRNTLSRYDLSENGSHLCIHFFPPVSRPQTLSFRLPLHFRLGSQTIAARERFWRTIDHARQAGGKANSPAAAAASASLQELLLWLHLQRRRSVGPRRSSLAEEALLKLAQAIETSLGKPMLIAELAAGVGLSADYIARLFAQRYGMTLQHYLLLRRIELARHLLVSSNLLVSEVGRQVGLPDPQYFNKQFRRVAGESPLAHRRRHAKKARARPSSKR
jgi:AraC-like DNA-binding protein